MTNTTQPDKGNLLVFINTSKERDDNKPAFEGKITFPGLPAERHVALWANVDDQGRTMLSGKLTDPPQAQIEAMARSDVTAEPITIPGKSKPLVLKPHDVVLFTNRSKSAEHPNRPDYYGYCHTGLPNAVAMHVSAWARTASNGKAMLTGSTSVYEPKEKDRVMEPAPPVPTKRRQRSKAMN